MTYLLVRLPAYRQLRKVAPDLLDESEAAIRATLGACCDELAAIAGSYLYVAGGTSRQMQSFAQAVCRLRESLAERCDGLQGYAIGILEEGHLEPDSALSRLRSFLLTVPPEDGVWTDESSMETLSRVFDLEPQEDSWRVEGVADAPSVRSDLRDRLLIDSSAAEKLHEAIVDYHGGITRARLCFLEGGDRLRRRRTAESVLEELFRGEDELKWLSTEAFCGYGQVRPAVMTTIRNGHQSFAGQGLDASKEEVWRRLEGRLLDDSLRYPSFSDVLNGLGIVLARYAAYARTVPVPFVWIVHDYDRLDETSRGAIKALFRRVSAEAHPFVLFTSAKEPPPQFDADAIYRIACGTGTEPAVIDTGSIKIPERFVSIVAYHYLHGRLYGLPAARTLVAENPSRAVAAGLSDSAKAILLTLRRTESILSLDRIAEFFRQRGVLEQRFKHDVEDLADLGFLVITDCVYTNPDLSDRIEAETTQEERSSLEIEVTGYCARLRQRREIPDSLALARLLSRSQHALAVTVYQGLLRDAYDAGTKTQLAELIDELANRPQREDPSLSALERAYRLRLEILKVSGVARTELPIFDDCPPGREGVYAELSCAASEYLYAQSAFADGLDWAKRSLMLSDGVDPVVEARANIQIGLNMLAFGKLGEAQAYFENAADRSERSGDRRGLVEANLYLATTLFLHGNLSRSARALEKARRIAGSCGAEMLGIQIDYVAARLDFELGAYDEAAGHCMEGLNRCMLYRLSEPQPVLSALLTRSMMYANRFAVSSEREEGLERLTERALVVAENRYFAGRRAEALQVIRESSREPHGARPWDGIFGPAERLAGIDVQERLCPAFESMLSAASTTESHSAVAEMIREERLDPNDPHNGLYCFLYASSIGSSGAGRNLDYVTALSRSAKYMQERAARIDDASVRQQYLRNNYWNRRILEQARANKLV